MTTTIPFSFDYDFWQQDDNVYYQQYLDYQREFLELTDRINLTDINSTAEIVEEEPWVVPVKWVACLILICLSATFSGLTLGLMGLDPYGLEIIIQADPEGIDAKRAAKILKFRRDGNLMLCTLLLGNVAVNALLPIYLDELLGQLVAFFISTFALVILGEITPQAVCSRYALAIGSKLIWLLVIFTVLLYVIAKPIALILDQVLGEEMGTIHNKNQLVEIVQFHMDQGVMDEDEAKAIKGALLYSDITVEKVMTNMEVVFSLREDDTLNFEKISAIFRTGHSRVPVLSKDDPDIVVGILLTKDLILVDPDDNMPVSEILDFFNRPVVSVTPSDTLGDVMALFKTGKAHLGVVTNNTTDIVKRRRDSDSDFSDEDSSSSSDSDSSDTEEGPSSQATTPRDKDGHKDGHKNSHKDGHGDATSGSSSTQTSPKRKKEKRNLSIAEKTVIALKKKKRKKKEKELKKRRKQKEKDRLASPAAKGSDARSPSAAGNDGTNDNAANMHQIVPVLPTEFGSPDADNNDSAIVEIGDSTPTVPLEDQKTRVLGVITLEDIIEEILGDEIVDETDRFVEMEKTDTSIKRERSQRVVDRISLLDSSAKDTLGEREAELIAQTLVDRIVNQLGSRADSMFHVPRSQLAETLRPAAMDAVKSASLETFSQGHVITRKNKACGAAHMVIDGLLDCFTGSGSFKSVVGRFQMVGAGVLEDCLLAQSQQVKGLAVEPTVGDVLDVTPSRRGRRSSDTPKPSRGRKSSDVGRGRRHSDAGVRLVRTPSGQYIADFTAIVASKKCRVVEFKRVDFAKAFRATMMLEGSPRAERSRARSLSAEKTQ